MNKNNFLIAAIISVTFCFLYSCNPKPSADSAADDMAKDNPAQDSLIKEGAYLASLVGCVSCHTPTILTDKGPQIDSTRLFAGYDARSARISDVKGLPEGWLVGDNHHNSFYGDWGISFAANLTPDDTGIGNWSEAQFKKAMVDNKFMGIDEERNILPPMRKFPELSDHDIKALFAFLKSMKPVRNIVPAYVPAGKIKN